MGVRRVAATGTTWRKAIMENTQEIGENAGKVWQVLSEKGPQSVSSISKHARLGANETERAIGWLAREGKLSFASGGRGTTVSLAGN